MAARDVVLQLYVNGAWTTYPAFATEGWRVHVGPGETTGVRPNSLTVTLADPTGKLDPSHPESELYGVASVNTPMRLQIDGTTVIAVEASSWEPDHTSEFDPVAGRGRAWITVSGEDILRRVGRWTDVRPSTLRRTIPASANLVGYWPLEGGEGSSGVLSSGIADGRPGVASGVNLSGDAGPGGSDVCLTLDTGGIIRGDFPPHSGTEWQFIWHTNLAVPGSPTDLPIMTVLDSLGRRWQMLVGSGGRRTTVTDADGAILYDEATAYGGTENGSGWIRWRLQVTHSGGTTSVKTSWFSEFNKIAYVNQDTFSSSGAGTLVSWSAESNAHTNGAGYCHIAGEPEAVRDWIIALEQRSSVNGYINETAGNRIERLATESGLTCVIVGDDDDTSLMGAQRGGKTTIQHFEECQSTDGGILYGDIDTPTAISYSTRKSSYAQTPVMALQKGDLSTTPRRIIGDVGAANLVVVQNSATEGSALYEVTTGARSTSSPPDGVGEYRELVDVNQPDDTELTQRASWEAHQGTVDGARYPKLVVNLGVATHLRAAAATLKPGDLISLDGVEPDTVYLRVVSYDREGNNTRDMLTLTCTPATIWRQVGIYDTGRSDSSSTTLSATVLPTESSLVFSTVDAGDAWSTTSEPYDVMISGERVRVTSMGAVSGSGPYLQTATVTRSINGIRKQLPAGASVRLAEPARYAL